MSSIVYRVRAALIFITFATLVHQINCEMTLQLKMDSFLNPFGRKHDQACCHSSLRTPLNEVCARNCTTYFRFCLNEASAAADDEPRQSASCVYEFVSNILGGDSITPDQFKLTTDSVGFPGIDEKLSERLELTIEVLNQADESGHHGELISRWSLEIANKKSADWRVFEEKSLSVFHKLTFQYRMKCSRNFYGDNCQFKSTERELKCENGGVCEINDQTGKKFCKCNSFLFKGDRCQYLIGQSKCSASASPCLNGGTCLANGECLCAPGYVDDRCQTPRLENQCGKITCYNGGSCFINSLNKHACACESAFTGEFCQTRVNVCLLERQPCQNGGQCFWNAEQGSHGCLCRSGFSGADCSVASTTTTATSTPTSTTTRPIEVAQLAFLTPASRVEQKPSFGSLEAYTLLTFGLGFSVLAGLVVFLVCRLNAKHAEAKRALQCAAEEKSCKLEKGDFERRHNNVNIYSVDLSDLRPPIPRSAPPPPSKIIVPEPGENIYSVIPLDTLF